MKMYNSWHTLQCFIIMKIMKWLQTKTPMRKIHNLQIIHIGYKLVLIYNCELCHICQGINKQIMLVSTCTKNKGDFLVLCKLISHIMVNNLTQSSHPIFEQTLDFTLFPLRYINTKRTLLNHKWTWKLI